MEAEEILKLANDLINPQTLPEMVAEIEQKIISCKFEIRKINSGNKPRFRPYTEEELSKFAFLGVEEVSEIRNRNKDILSSLEDELEKLQKELIRLKLEMFFNPVEEEFDKILKIKSENWSNDFTVLGTKILDYLLQEKELLSKSSVEFSPFYIYTRLLDGLRSMIYKKKVDLPRTTDFDNFKIKYLDPEHNKNLSMLTEAVYNYYNDTIDYTKLPIKYLFTLFLNKIISLNQLRDRLKYDDTKTYLQEEYINMVFFLDEIQFASLSDNMKSDFGLVVNEDLDWKDFKKLESVFNKLVKYSFFYKDMGFDLIDRIVDFLCIVVGEGDKEKLKLYMSKWMASDYRLGQYEDPRVFQNLICYKKLKDAGELDNLAKLGIYTFARYPYSYLLSLKREYDRNDLPNILLAVNTMDHNGVFYNLNNLVEYIESQIIQDGLLLTTEIKNLFDIVRYVKIREENSLPVPSVIIVSVHGSAERVHFSNKSLGKVSLEWFNDRRLDFVQQFLKDRNIQVIFNSCGVGNTTSQVLTDLIAAGTVFAPDKSVYGIEDIIFNFDPVSGFSVESVEFKE